MVVCVCVCVCYLLLSLLRSVLHSPQAALVPADACLLMYESPALGVQDRQVVWLWLSAASRSRYLLCIHCLEKLYLSLSIFRFLF